VRSLQQRCINHSRDTFRETLAWIAATGIGSDKKGALFSSFKKREQTD
jgi:hypothetical protein